MQLLAAVQQTARQCVPCTLRCALWLSSVIVVSSPELQRSLAQRLVARSKTNATAAEQTCSATRQAQQAAGRSRRMAMLHLQHEQLLDTQKLPQLWTHTASSLSKQTSRQSTANASTQRLWERRRQTAKGQTFCVVERTAANRQTEAASSQGAVRSSKNRWCR